MQGPFQPLITAISELPMNWLVLGPALLFAAVIGVLLVLTFITSLVEKRGVASIGTTPWDPAKPLAPYLVETNEAVARNSFEFGGTFAHAKGGIYETAATLWRSPDRSVLVVVYGGKTAKIRTRKTMITSVLDDGQHLVSCDEAGICDPTKKMERVTLRNAGFDELLAFHYAQIAATGKSPTILPDIMPGELMRQMERERADSLVAHGYARYRDAERMFWSSTLKGAWFNAFINFSRELAKSKEQSHRSKMRRAGD